jgi:site-specific recombinase XerD
VKSGRPLLNSNVCQYFKDLCERAGLGRDWTTNELRHSFASVADEMLNDRKLVGKVMGHKKEATTAGYIHSVHAVRPVIANAVEAWTLMLALPAATEAKSA